MHIECEGAVQRSTCVVRDTRSFRLPILNCSFYSLCCLFCWTWRIWCMNAWIRVTKWLCDRRRFRTELQCGWRLWIWEKKIKSKTIFNLVNEKPDHWNRIICSRHTTYTTSRINVTKMKWANLHIRNSILPHIRRPLSILVLMCRYVNYAAYFSTRLDWSRAILSVKKKNKIEIL